MILKNVQILQGQVLQKKDIEIRGEVITRIENEIPEDGINLHGLYCMPGLTDIHVHFRQPGFEKKETILTGSMSAAKGGYTTVFLMPNLNPVPDNLGHLKVEEDIIATDSKIECIPYASVTVGEKSMEVSDIDNLRTHTRYFSDDGVGFSNMDVLKSALEKIKKYDLFVASHAEDKVYKTKREGEYLAVEREINLAKEVGCGYHFCHMSTIESFDLIRKAKKEGLPITCEVAPHHLFLEEGDIHGNPNFKMNPPLRTHEDRLATVRALLDGTADVIATDHAPHTLEEKSREYDKCPNGIIGLETAAPLVYTNLVKPGIATFANMEDWMSNNPRRLTHLPLNEVRVGGIANLCFLDIEHEHTYTEEEILSMGKNSPFLNMKLYGFNALTIYKGKIVYKREDIE
jgi:dihydroorotase